MAVFVDWYNHQHRHSDIKFVTPHQRHGGQALEICRHCTVVYEYVANFGQLLGAIESIALQSICPYSGSQT